MRLLREHISRPQDPCSTSDILFPSYIAKMAIKESVESDKSDVDAVNISEMESQATQQIATMLGYNTDPAKNPCAIGQITTSSKTANYECLRSARTISFYPLAMNAVAKKLHLDLKLAKNSNQLLSECDRWQCQNFSIQEVITLREYCYQQLLEKEGTQSATNFFKQVYLHSIEHVGMAAFFAEHWDAKQPLVLIPSTAGNEWEKAMRLLGFGSSQLIKLDVNNRMRVDVNSLNRILSNAEQKKIPILAVIGILGTDEHGSIDPLVEMVELRNQFSRKGLNFYFHIDASRGGYLSSMFRRKDGSLLSFNEVRSQFNKFPSKNVYQAYSVVHEADSVTIDPRKSGYLPFNISAFIRKNSESANLILKDAHSFSRCKKSVPFNQTEDYKLEGTQSLIDVAAYSFTQKTLPLNNMNFGQVISESIHNSEYLRNKIEGIIDNLKDKVNMVIPLKPDTNILCVAINPINNYSLRRMNRFSNRVFEQLQSDLRQSDYNYPFHCSTSSLLHSHIGSEDAQYILKKLGIRNSSFVVNIEDPDVQTNSIHILKCSLLNPWRLTRITSTNAIDNYCKYLERVITEIVTKESSNSLFAVSAS